MQRSVIEITAQLSSSADNNYMEPIPKIIIAEVNQPVNTEFAQERAAVAAEVQARYELGSMAFCGEPVVVFEYPLPGET